MAIFRYMDDVMDGVMDAARMDGVMDFVDFTLKMIMIFNARGGVGGSRMNDNPLSVLALSKRKARTLCVCAGCRDCTNNPACFGGVEPQKR